MEIFGKLLFKSKLGFDVWLLLCRECGRRIQKIKPNFEYEQFKIRIAPDGLSFTGGWNPLKTDTGNPESSARASGYYDSQKIDNLDGLVDDDLLNQLRNQ